uniref:Uncharacterized protein n=1 Tax=Rhizophagus irregularis (strain DAOM 181602 / DAOM 197198 / MUCL 43194) TaxID=747089 RepID=U9U3N2_RHIID
MSEIIQDLKIHVVDPIHGIYVIDNVHAAGQDVISLVIFLITGRATSSGSSREVGHYL